MLLDVVLLIVGLAILYFGAEGMVKGASQLALALGISPLIVGLTVVAFGTSAPELVISVIAAIQGSTGISVGNIVGSNICNVALILGTAALISPLAVDAGSLRREYPIMIVAALLFYFLAFDGTLGLVDGIVLFVGITLFVVYNMWMARRHIKRSRESAARRAEEAVDSADEEEAGLDVEVPEKESSGHLKNVIFLIGGLIGLTVGAQLMVDSAASIARSMGISDLIIGITIVAFGTSLPELATSVVAAVRKESDISIGNVVGSNIFNVLFVMGIVPMISDIEVEDIALQVDFPVMLGVLVIAFPLLRHRYQLGRGKGSVLLAIYAMYTIYLFLR